MPKITSKLKKIDKGKPRRMTKKTPQESKVRKRPGYSTGGSLQKDAAATRQQQAAQAQSSTGQGRIMGPSTGPSRGPKLKTVTLAKPKPQESKVRKRPGFAHGGEMQILKPN